MVEDLRFNRISKKNSLPKVSGVASSGIDIPSNMNLRQSKNGIETNRIVRIYLMVLMS